MAVDQRLVLAMLPLAAVALAEQRHAQERAVEEFWLAFHDAAPAPVWDYVMAIDAELKGVDPAEHDRWLKRCHPCVEDVFDALEHAVHNQVPDRLAFVQGWLVQWSEWRLGYWYARERAAGVRATVYDDVVRELAAQALLGWSNAESHAVWLEPTAFAERWRVAGTTDREILAHAGLHDAELTLLAAADETV